jgi:hypothetical protein
VANTGRISTFAETHPTAILLWSENLAISNQNRPLTGFSGTGLPDFKTQHLPKYVISVAMPKLSTA